MGIPGLAENPRKWFATQEEQDRQIRELLAPFRGREDELLRRRRKNHLVLVVNNDKTNA